jgi:chromosome segregation ATPase
MSSPQYPYAPHTAPPPPTYAVPQPAGPNLKVALAAGAIVASLAANGFLLYQVHGLKTETAHNQEIMQNEIDTLKENSTVMTAASRKHMEDLREELENRSRQLSQAASQAKKEALTYADEQAKKLEDEQQKSRQELSSSISDVKQATDSVNAKVSDVNKDVDNVKTDLAGTKTDLNQTKTTLQHVAGDLGVTSGLVATNSSQIEELRRRGERDIVEFSLRKQKNMQKVSDVSLRLEKTDPKKNKFTLVLVADDKTVEKRDKNINEPLQFYVSKSLYEIVVNTVGKDQVAGYLSKPKYQNR